MPRPSKPWWRASSRTWVVKLNGQLHTLGKDKATATRRFHELKAEGRAVPSAQADTPLGALIAEYLEYQTSRITPACHRSYQWYLFRLSKKFGKHRVASTLDSDEVLAWIDSHATWGATTRHIGVQRIKAAFRHAARKKWIAANPMADLRGPSDRARESALTPEQYAEVMEKVSGGLRHLLGFLWETGCRPSEAFKLRLVDLDLDAGLATLVGKTTKKTGKDRHIYLTDVARQHLAACIDETDPSMPVFKNANGNPWTSQSVYKAIRSTRHKLAWGAILTPSVFRRTFATDGALVHTPHVLAHLMGHSSPSTLAKYYAKLKNRPEAMRAALSSVRASAEPLRKPEAARPLAASPAPPPPRKRKAKPKPDPR